MKRIIFLSAVFLVISWSSILISSNVRNNHKTEVEKDEQIEETYICDTESEVIEIEQLEMETTISEPEIIIEVSDNISISEDDIALIALVTMAEAEGECEEGKRLVIDTILNRVDSEYFPNTVYDVIYQPNQFSSMWNGRSNRCYVKEDICKLVREEAASRMNSDVIFFTAEGYGMYGNPMFKVGNHYFSSY